MTKVALGMTVLVSCSPLRTAAPPPPPPVATSQRFFSRETLVADLDSMLAMIERVHPNPYTVVSRDSVRATRNAIVARLPDSASRITVWPSFARLVAMMGDGHTDVSVPGEEVLRFMARGGVMFPVRTVAADSGRLTVSAYALGDSVLRRGDEILSVNGQSTDSLLRAFEDEVSGETVRWREQIAARQFESFLLLNGIRAPFTVVTRRSVDSDSRRVMLQGIGRDSLTAYNARATARATPATRNFSYRTLPDRTGYMNLVSLGGDVAQFGADLDRMFAQVRADSARSLIVDLRSNGGGDTRMGDELLSHLTTQPYRMASAQLWKMSREYRAHLKSLVRPPLNHLPIEKFFPTGRRLFSGPDGTIVRMDVDPEAHAAREPRFDGPVCVLIGALTFSSAVDLADAIKTYHLATLIGEETGGRGNSFGEVYYFRTPATGFLVSVSSETFVRANGDTTDHRGVVPDIEVHRAADDVRAARDPVLERARDCPSRTP